VHSQFDVRSPYVSQPLSPLSWENRSFYLVADGPNWFSVNIISLHVCFTPFGRPSAGVPAEHLVIAHGEQV